MTLHLASQRMLLPSAQVSSLATGNVTLPSSRLQFTEGNFISIASASGNGSSASITFAMIPQRYKHLQIRGIGQASYSSNDEGVIGVRLNGDSGSNYTRFVGITATGSVIQSGITLSATFADTGDGAFLNTGNTVGSSIIDILNYSNNSVNTSVRGIAGTDRNGAGSVKMGAGMWINTSIVHTVTLYQQNANFTSQSFYALYGIE